MPRYPHYCPVCQPTKEGPPIEIDLKISQLDDEQRCVICGSVLTRVISSESTFQLKGPGWSQHGYTKQHPPVAKANAGRPSRRNYK